MVALPLTVFISMRMMGFSGVASALGAAASTLLSGDFRYGFEYDSYTWRGFGMFTQLWAMHLSFLTLGATYRALQRGKGLWLAALLLGMLVLTHLIYSYMMGITILILAVWGVTRATAVTRFLRLAVMVGFAAAISSYMWLPFITQSAYLNATPYLQPEKYDSFGAGPILTWLFTGDLLDHGRLPVLTILLGLGILSAIAGARGRKTGAGLLLVVLFCIWLVIYFGRATLGSLADLFPFHDGLLFHRFIGAVELAAIPLMGLGGAVVWRLVRGALGAEGRAREGAPWRLLAAGAVLVAILAPAIAERVTFYSYNTAWEQRSYDAVQADPDQKAIIAKIKTLPPGRVFAGLPTSFGNVADMTYWDLHFYNLLPFNGIESLAPPTESLSLNSDYIWDFNEHDPADYELWNVRYVVAPATLPVDDFLTPILKTNRFVLYGAPTSGYAEYGGIASRRAVADRPALFEINRAWERTGTLPAEHLFMRYDYPSKGIVTDPSNTQPCPDGGHTEFEAFRAGKIDLVVSCPAASTLVIKTTYHPNWQVTVDGSVVEDFMVSPSYIGVSLPAGKHSVSATYVADAGQDTAAGLRAGGAADPAGPGPMARPHYARSLMTQHPLGKLLLIGLIVVGIAACAGKSDAQLAADALTAGLQAQTAGNLDEASRQYQICLQHDTLNKFCLFDLGLIAQTQDRLNEAENNYRLALLQDPTFASPLFNLAIIRTAAGSVPEAIGLYRQFVQVAPDDPGGHLNLGLLLRDTGDTAGADAEFATAVRLNPQLTSRPRQRHRTPARHRRPRRRVRWRGAPGLAAPAAGGDRPMAPRERPRS